MNCIIEKDGKVDRDITNFTNCNFQKQFEEAEKIRFTQMTTDELLIEVLLELRKLTKEAN